MKNFALVVLAAFAIGLTGCKRPVETPPTPPGGGTPINKTELELVVADSAMNPLSMASVELYKSQTDYATRKETARVQGIHYTNSFGRLTVSSLEPIQYWFYIENDDKTKTNMGDVTSVTLVKDKKTTQVVKLK